MTNVQKYQSLPAWIYSDPDFFELERHQIFMKTWQLVCHVSNIPNPGDYFTFDLMQERVFAIRGEDGEVRTFHNVCRHRASRLLKGEKGKCKRIKCPYHAWAYDLEGNLKSVPFERDFVDFNKKDHGLSPVEMEIWQGFIFIRFGGDGRSVEETMAPYRPDIEKYRLEEVEPIGRVTIRPRDANWKTVIDNYVDALHIEVAHAGLTGLFGNTYSLEVKDGVQKLWGDIVPTNKETLSVRMYKKYLPKDCKRTWEYFRLWPNLAFDLYPDQVDFMQILPVSPTTMVIREISYARKDERREMMACRYLNWRINREVNAEDHELISNVEAGMRSSSYTSGPFAEREICLIDAAEQMRNAIPIACQNQKPSPDEMTKLIVEARGGWA
ncbi:MAG: aromatic ring-hydroxylating oxygenase subunit alpha [Alphaproteobacteria bacterium]